MELLGREAQPGIDYALTEIVHCKSKHETGVREAEDFCANRYLKRVLSLSAAGILVVLGKAARQAMARQFALPSELATYGPLEFVVVCAQDCPIRIRV